MMKNKETMRVVGGEKLEGGGRTRGLNIIKSPLKRLSRCCSISKKPYLSKRTKDCHVMWSNSGWIKSGPSSSKRLPNSRKRVKDDFKQ